MKNILNTLLLSVTEFITELAIKAVIYNNKGNKIPTGYTTHKIFNKISDYYSDSIKGSGKTGISALLEARKNLLSDINKLTVSSYTSTVKPSSGAALTTDKKVIQAKTILTKSKDDLEDIFITNYPSLKTLKNLFFKLDNKQETLKFIQSVLIKVVKYTFWPLLFITIYIYIIKIFSIGALFLGAGYGYLRYSGLDVQTNDITKLASVVRDYVINFWTRLINRAFNIKLANETDIYQQAYDQARNDVYVEESKKAFDLAKEHFDHKEALLNKHYAERIQDLYNWFKSINTKAELEEAKKHLSSHVFTPEPPTDNVYIGDGTFVVDTYVNKLSGFINSLLPSYDTVINTTVITVASITAAAALAIYLHRGGTLWGHEENVKKVYQTTASFFAAKVLGEEWIFEEKTEDGKTVRTFSLKKGRSGSASTDDNETITEHTEEPTCSKDKGVVRHTPDNTSNSTTQPSSQDTVDSDSESDSGTDSDDSTTGTVTPNNNNSMNRYFTDGSIPLTKFTKLIYKEDALSSISKKELADIYVEVHKEFQDISQLDVQKLNMQDKVSFYVLRDNFNKISSVAIKHGLLYSTCKHPIKIGETSEDPCSFCE